MRLSVLVLYDGQMGNTLRLCDGAGKCVAVHGGAYFNMFFKKRPVWLPFTFATSSRHLLFATYSTAFKEIRITKLVMSKMSK